MSDAEILDWLQSNCLEMRERLDDTFYIAWFDGNGIIRTTEGASLRDCVERAKDYQFMPNCDI